MNYNGIAINEAQDLDFRIKAYANAAWSNLVEACKCLKRMRDTKMYTELGYDTFGEYTEKSLNIKERQAYTYISTIEAHGEAFLQSNANLGITKLSLLSGIPATDRQDFVEQNDLENMTVEQVKALVAQNDGRAEQILLLEDEVLTLKETLAAEDEKAVEAEKIILDLKKELEFEKNKPVEVAVQEPDEETINRIKSQAAEDAKQQCEKEFKAEKKELKKKFDQEREQKIAEAVRETKKELDEYKKRAQELEKEAVAAIEKISELNNQLTVNASPEAAKFTFFFDELNQNYDKLISSLEKLKYENAEVSQKFAEAMKKYHVLIMEKFAKIGFPLEG